MKLYQLEYFIEVFESGGVSKAAENLFVSQPAISFGIKELEDEFGVKFFIRAGNKIIPTEAGMRFYERACGIIKEVQLLRKEMLSFGESTLIKVGTPPMIGAFLFPELYNEFNKAYPNIKIEILEYGSLQAQNLVINNNADVAIAILNNIEDDTLETNILFKTELVFCVNNNHPLAVKKTISLAEIEEQDIILMKEDSYQNAVIKRHFAENNLKPNILLYSSQLTTIRNFILNSGAGAFLFREVAEADQGITPLALETPIFLNIGILWKKNPRLYNSVKNFIAFTKDFVVRKFNK